MVTDKSTLNRAGRAASQAVDGILLAMECVEQGENLRARAVLDRANESAQDAVKVLLRAGADIPELGPPAPVPLHLLNTAATRRLLRILRQAQEAAEDVDAERGNVLPADFPLQLGESRGTGWAETISNLVERLRVEVEGPKSSRGE